MFAFTRTLCSEKSVYIHWYIFTTLSMTINWNSYFMYKVQKHFYKEKLTAESIREEWSF